MSSLNKFSIIKVNMGFYIILLDSDSTGCISFRPHGLYCRNHFVCQHSSCHIFSYRIHSFISNIPSDLFLLFLLASFLITKKNMPIFLLNIVFRVGSNLGCAIKHKNIILSIKKFELLYERSEGLSSGRRYNPL